MSDIQNINFIHTEAGSLSDTSNGKGIVVAVLDTGVDPGVNGLKITSDGKPKVIDIVDCTGEGDMTMSDIYTLEKLEERPFTPSYGFESIKKQVKFKKSDRFRYSSCMLKSILNLRRFKCKESVDFDKMNYYIVTIVTILEDSDLNTTTHIRIGDTIYESVEDYKNNQKYYTLSYEGYDINFGVKFYDDGKTINLVFESGYHGTHVAGIVGAYFPDNSNMNGVAPGCQIVSLKIGDSRINGLETTTALIRAMNEIVERDIHLVNLSFGEPVNECGSGILIKQIENYCRHHNIIFVSSAGNSGPNLMSISAPSASSSDIISVGAYADDDMLKSMYFKNMFGNSFKCGLYPWSSRGPTNDGSIGVDVVAPGGAITTVSSWHKSNLKLLNGTSMASPYACGCIARILSSMDQIPYYYWVKRLLINNAEYDDIDGEEWDYGGGLLHTQDTYNDLVKLQKYKLDYGYDVRCKHLNSNSSNMRGIILRFCDNHGSDDYLNDDSDDNSDDNSDDGLDELENFDVTINPYFFHKVDKTFMKELTIHVASDIKEYVIAPEKIFVNSYTATFPVAIKKSLIDESIMSKIKLIDESIMEIKRFVVATIPVTVFVSDEKLQLNKKIEKTVTLKGSEPKRIFVSPVGNVIELKIKSLSEFTHAEISMTQLNPNIKYNSQSKKKRISTPATLTMDVVPNTIVELCLHQFITDNKKCEISYSISCNVKPIVHDVSFTHDGLSFATLTKDDIPYCRGCNNKLTTVTSLVNPMESKIDIYSLRHMTQHKHLGIEPKTVYKLTITYNVPSSAGKYKVGVDLEKDIYESCMISSAFMTGYHVGHPVVYGYHNNMCIDICDIEKITVSFIANDKKKLESLRNIPIHFNKAIEIDINCYTTRIDAINKTDNTRIAKQGTYYFRPDFDDLEIMSNFGNYLFMGKILSTPINVLRIGKIHESNESNKSNNEIELLNDLIGLINPTSVMTGINHANQIISPIAKRMGMTESDINGIVDNYLMSVKSHNNPKMYAGVRFYKKLLYLNDVKGDDLECPLENLIEDLKLKESHPFYLLKNIHNKSTSDDEMNGYFDLIKKNIDKFTNYNLKDMYKYRATFVEKDPIKIEYYMYMGLNSYPSQAR